MVAQHLMLAWLLCDFPNFHGIRTGIAKETYSFVIFQGGGGGGGVGGGLDPLFPPLDQCMS